MAVAAEFGLELLSSFGMRAVCSVRGWGCFTLASRSPNVLWVVPMLNGQITVNVI